jgi:endonuclease YncB( thermonuclease family)
MEVVVLIAFLVLFIVVKRHASPTAPPHVPSVPSARRNSVTPPPFDQKTATHLPEPETLKGAAYVIDGDSIVINKTQVRLYGVDAPEMNHPYGKKAKWALVALCKGQTIRAEITDRDTHGRAVAKCFLPDGRDLSAEMVKQGLAIDWPKFSGGAYRALEVADARKKMWLADARQKGRMHVWQQFEARQRAKG